MHLLTEDIKKIIEQSGLVSDADFLSVIAESERSGRTVLDILIGKGFIDEKYLAENTAKFFNVPAINLSSLNISKEILEIIPEAFAKSRGVILFEFDKLKKCGKLARRKLILHCFLPALPY